MLLLFTAIALVLGGLLYRFLPGAIRRYVDLDSSLGELLAFVLGAACLVALLVGALAVLG